MKPDDLFFEKNRLEVQKREGMKFKRVSNMFCHIMYEDNIYYAITLDNKGVPDSVEDITKMVVKKI